MASKWLLMLPRWVIDRIRLKCCVSVDKRLYLVAKVIGTETSRVVGTSVDGKAGDELAPLAEKLAGQVADVIAKQDDRRACLLADSP